MNTKKYIKLAKSIFNENTDEFLIRRKKLGIDRDYYPSIESFVLVDNQYKQLYPKDSKSVSNAFEFINKLSEKEELRFLDVGSGYGHILYYFSKNSKINILHGLEVDSDYTDIFDKYLFKYFDKRKSVEIKNIDAFDFNKYNEYNFIWFFTPIANETKCKELYKFVIKNVEKGTYLLDIGHMNFFGNLKEMGAPIEVYKDFGKVKIYKRTNGNYNLKLNDNTMGISMKVNLEKMNINWDDYIIPSMDGKDISLFREIMKENYEYEPIDHSDMEHHIFSNKVAVKFPGEMGTLISSSPDNSSLFLLEDTFECWPEMKNMVSEMMDYFIPALRVDNEGNVIDDLNIGCSCGIYGNAPFKTRKHDEPYDVTIMATVDGVVGTCEGLVHELGHYKLHAIGIDLEEWTGQLFTNEKDEVFHSPVRFDKKRPIAAVVQAEFSYIYVTEFYNKFLKWMEDNNKESYETLPIDGYYQRQAYNIKRIGNGIHTIKKVAKLTDEGKRFMESFMNYAERVWKDGYLCLKNANKLEKFDWEPVEGKPVEVE